MKTVTEDNSYRRILSDLYSYSSKQLNNMSDQECKFEYDFLTGKEAKR